MSGPAASPSSSPHGALAGETRRTPSEAYRWWMFSGICAVYFAFGVMVASMAPLVSTIREDLGISRGAMGFALGAWAFIYIFTAPPAGRLLDRLGLRRAITIGTLILLASGLMRAAVTNLATLWLAIGLFGIGGPLISAGAPKLISVWFDDARERRIAVGAYAAAPALGGSATLAITNSVLVPWLEDWRYVLLAHSSVMVAALIFWSVVAARAPITPTVPMAAPSNMLASWRVLLESSGVRLALILGIGVFYVNHSLSNWFPNLLEEDSGFSKSAASGWVAISVLLGVVLTLIVPRQATAERRTSVLAAVLATTAAGLLIVVLAPKMIDPVGVLLAAARVALVPIVVLILLDAEGVTPGNSGEANGMWFSFAEIGGVLGPLTFGFVADTGLGFTGSLTILVVLLGLLVVLTLARRTLISTVHDDAAARPATL